MFCSWGTRPAEVPKGDRGRSGRKVVDPNTTHNRKVVHFGGGSGRQPGRGSGTVARGGPGRGRREVVEEAREDIRESTTTTNPTTRRRRRRRGRFKILSFVRPEVGLENSIRTSGRSRRTRSRRRSSQPSSVNRRRSILHIRSWTHSKTRAPPQPQREREFRTILNRPLDTSKLKF